MFFAMAYVHLVRFIMDADPVSRPVSFDLKATTADRALCQSIRDDIFGRDCLVVVCDGNHRKPGTIGHAVRQLGTWSRNAGPDIMKTLDELQGNVDQQTGILSDPGYTLIIQAYGVDQCLTKLQGLVDRYRRNMPFIPSLHHDDRVSKLATSTITYLKSRALDEVINTGTITRISPIGEMVLIHLDSSGLSCNMCSYCVCV